MAFFASASQWINYTKSPWRIYRVRVNRAVLESNNTEGKTHAMLARIHTKEDMMQHPLVYVDFGTWSGLISGRGVG